MEAFSANSTLSTRPDLARMVKDGKTDEEILHILMQENGDGPAVRSLMQEVKKLRSARSNAAGLMFILIGGFILFLSCVLGIMKFYSDSSLSFVLYGLTTVGILIVFVGLMKIFG